MGELQWALLIVCVAMVLALYVLSRRGKSDRDDDQNPMSGPDRSGDQMDLLSPPRGGAYDEFGVGPKRKRGEPAAGAGDAPVREPPAPSMATLLNPLPGQPPVAPRLNLEPQIRAAPSMPVSEPAPTMAESKLVALIVAPTEETDILGPQLHTALVALGLKFGEGSIYHRSIGGRTVYSVASLLKPGKLVPEDAATFSTKGLTLVLNLPGPVSPAVALDDMLSTARSLASALRSEIFDARRQRLTEEVSAALRADVQDWARAQKLG